MKESLGETTITSKHKPRENYNIKEKRNTMKEKTNFFNQACKNGSNIEKTTILEKYTKPQTDLRNEIEKAEQETINTTMEKNNTRRGRKRKQVLEDKEKYNENK